MNKPELVILSGDMAELGSNRLQSVLETESATVFGNPTPRIHTPLNDLPSKGFELIDFADTIL